MADIQRWRHTHLMGPVTCEIVADSDGGLVTYADHVAAVAAARAEAVKDYKRTTEALGEFFEPYHMPVWSEGYTKGLADLGESTPPVGYHSQRCLNCDHIRATHTLTATGCLGHAVPGRIGSDCPCSEFMDVELTTRGKGRNSG